MESGRLGRLGLNVDDIDLEDLIHVVAIDDINGGPAWSWRQVIQDDLTDDEDLVSIAACALRDFNLDGSHAIVGVCEPSLPLCRDWRGFVDDGDDHLVEVAVQRNHAERMGTGVLNLDARNRLLLGFFGRRGGLLFLLARSILERLPNRLEWQGAWVGDAAPPRGWRRLRRSRQD